MMLVSAPTPDIKDVTDSIQTQKVMMMEEDLESKSLPQFLKDYQVKDPDAHLLAIADWMEAMQLRSNDFIDNFKHTLQHLACEWYHVLDIDDFHGTGMNLPHILADTSPHKEKY